MDHPQEVHSITPLSQEFYNISKFIPDLASAMMFPNAADLPILPNDLMRKLLNVLVII
jgi:hypothetical protein